MYKVSRVYNVGAVSLNSDPSLIAALDVPDVDILVLSIQNTGAGPVSSFSIKAKAISGNNEATLIKSSGYGAPDFHVIHVSSDPSSLPSGGSTLIYINVSMLDYIELWGKSASGTTLSILAKGVLV